MMAARARFLDRSGADALNSLLQEANRTDLATLALPRQAGALYGATLAASQSRNFALAQRYLEQLRALLPSDLAATNWVRLLAAELALAAGDHARAAAELGQDTSAGTDRKSGVLRPQLLLRAQIALQPESGQSVPTATALSDAAQALQSWLLAHGSDAQAWQLLASIEWAQGQNLRAIRSEAEAQVARLDYAAALDRFKAAQDLARQRSGNTTDAAADHIEASIIDVRQRQLRALLKEQALER